MSQPSAIMRILEWPYYAYVDAKAGKYIPLIAGFAVPYYLYGSPVGGDLQSMAMWYGVGGLAFYAGEQISM